MRNKIHDKTKINIEYCTCNLQLAYLLNYDIKIFKSNLSIDGVIK